jgi:hypothetical protein
VGAVKRRYINVLGCALALLLKNCFELLTTKDVTFTTKVLDTLAQQQCFMKCTL